MNTTHFFRKLRALPDGATPLRYRNRRYLFRKSTLLEGKLIKLYAEELGGNDFISGNYYVSLGEGVLKPCEMPESKVIDFILHAEPL